jgi:ubiquinol-cytochrome c reductase cytochrome c1 subunit
MRKLFLAFIFAPMTVFAAGSDVKLDRAPDRTRDLAALQNGAKLFVNYCLNCHSASYMRYNRLADIGLSDDQIKSSLLFTADKVGEPMKVAMQPAESRQWFGAAPPDLTVIARSRASGAGSGADWLYTYLRTFYRDDARPTGWNNLTFENVGMPHVFWQLQGEQVLKVSQSQDAHGHTVSHKKLELAKPGTMTPQEYDSAIADLVSFLVYMGEPAAETRKQIGIAVIFVLSLLLALAYLLKKNYWKDVH